MRSRCIECGYVGEATPINIFCSKCGGLIDIEVIYGKGVSWDSINGKEPSIWRYRELLPIPRNVKRVSLGEGCTPLIRADRLPGLNGSLEIYVKFEGANPTGSFKDRGMSVAVSLANHYGLKRFIVASTGNTSASAAAYVSRIGGKCIVLVPFGAVAKGKLAQAILHGAEIYEVRGSFDVALDRVRKILMYGETIYPLNSLNPWRLEGQKTIAYEIAEFLGDIPDYVVLPVGNAGNIYAIGKGFLELYNLGMIDRLPRLIGVQAKGASPMTRLWREGGDRLIPIERPETIATAIRIGNPVNWRRALKIVRRLNGVIIDVDDDEILYSQKVMARYIGVGCEPAGAASLAGTYKLYRDGYLDRGDRVICVATGHALKDPDIIMKMDYSRRVYDPDELLNVLLERD